MRFFQFLTAILAILTFSYSSYADEKLQQLKNISNSGAPFLTLMMLDQTQPNMDANLQNWIRWEQERYDILEKWQQWNDLLIRIESLPKDLPEDFRHTAVSKQVNAYLQLGQTTTARKILRKYLWDPQSAKSAEYENWRKYIVNSYIHDGRFDDARMAMQRFQQDFDSQDFDWVERKVLVLIQSEHYEEASDLLKNHIVPRAQVLSLYVDLLLNRHTPQYYWTTARQKAEKAEKAEEDSEIYVMYWMIAWSAAHKMSEVDRVIALEKILQTPHFAINEIFKSSANDLWSAYLDYAELVGNRAELLQGDDKSWLELAGNASKLTPIKARSLFAKIMLHSRSSEYREQAAAGFLQTLQLSKQRSKNLLINIFNDNIQFKDVSSIPITMRFELVDLALKKANIIEATRLMSGLETLPENTDLFAWQLRRARVLILGGQNMEGHNVLETLIKEYATPEKSKTDRIIQVLFDLQTIGAHENVLDSFQKLMALEIDPRQKREILFWMADSYKELEKHNQAALLYLQSAMYPGPDSMDPWAQTARYAAAESLQASGLADDARRIFSSLIEVTEEEAKKAMLRNKIQQLWLHQSIH